MRAVHYAAAGLEKDGKAGAEQEMLHSVLLRNVSPTAVVLAVPSVLSHRDMDSDALAEPCMCL